MRVEIQNLRKHYGPTRAVNDISFSFSSGQIFGFVGPNGAGKSTTMRILATLDEPTAGDCLIDGVSVVEEPEKAHRLVGYVPDALPDHRDISRPRVPRLLRPRLRPPAATSAGGSSRRSRSSPTSSASARSTSTPCPRA